MKSRGTTLARPKRGSKPKRIVDAEADPQGARINVAIVSIKGSAELHRFVNEVAEKEGMSVAQCFRQAYREWCKARKHGTPPHP